MGEDARILGPGGETLYDGEDSVSALRRELEEAVADRRTAERNAEFFAYELLSQMGDKDSQDLDIKDRRKFAKQARDVWKRDPQAGALVDLYNDFTFGRGVPRPRAKDDYVQQAINEAWDDPDNQAVLTSFQAQMKLGTDLTLQSNVFYVMFDDGEDGRVKLSTLIHDNVTNAVRDENHRHRVLWYVTEERERTWDFKEHRYKQDAAEKPKVVYYEHWRNFRDAEEAGETPPKPKDKDIGDGKVFHLAINATGEMVFGVPTMRRLLKWLSAYNEFMAARVDVTKAAASFIMKRKVRGGPQAVANAASRQISRQSEIAGTSPAGTQTPPAGTLVENDAISHEAFSLPTNSAGAQQDGGMILGQVAAAGRFPKHYLGLADGASMAMANAMELPVLKAIENRQEIVEALFRWFIDRVIERAVETGRIPARYSPDELQEAYGDRHGDIGDDENERDLSYEFSMPHPLRRSMGELINGVANLARTFDPNGMNVELSRTLLAIALGEALEVENPADVVDRIFPEGYQDPALAAFQAQQEAQGIIPPGTSQNQENPEAFQGADGNYHTSQNPYGTVQKPDKPERYKQKHGLQETALQDFPERVVLRTRGRVEGVEEEYDGDIVALAREQLGRLEQLPLVEVNGNGGKQHG